MPLYCHRIEYRKWTFPKMENISFFACFGKRPFFRIRRCSDVLVDSVQHISSLLIRGGEKHDGRGPSVGLLPFLVKAFSNQQKVPSGMLGYLSFGRGRIVYDQPLPIGKEVRSSLVGSLLPLNSFVFSCFLRWREKSCLAHFANRRKVLPLSSCW